MTDLSLTDTGNARRLALRYGDRLRYDTTRGRWRVYAAGRWALDDTGDVERMAQDTIRAFAQEALDGNRQAELGHAHRSLSRRALRHMIELAQVEAGLVVRGQDFDANPWHFNVANGTLDLRTGRLQAHDPADLCARMSDVPFDPTATCPHWMAFLDGVFQGDGDLVGFFQRAVGYSLTGDTSEQCLFFAYGTGANGKTTAIERLRTVLGTYGSHADFSAFTAKRSDSGPRNDIARLAGSRFVSAVEIEQGHRLAEGLVKLLTGGDVVTARYLFAEAFEFRPAFKVWWAGNHRPTVRDTSEGLWRRIRLIPFRRTFAEHERDPELPARLDHELPGILRWAVEGCLAWQRDRLSPPTIVLAATADYRAEEDAVGEFLDETCAPASGERLNASRLYQRFGAWAQSRGERPMTATAFGRDLAGKGYHRLKSRGANYWIGLRLLPESLSPEDGGRVGEGLTPISESSLTRARGEGIGKTLPNPPQPSLAGNPAVWEAA